MCWEAPEFDYSSDKTVPRTVIGNCVNDRVDVQLAPIDHGDQAQTFTVVMVAKKQNLKKQIQSTVLYNPPTVSTGYGIGITFTPPGPNGVNNGVTVTSASYAAFTVGGEAANRPSPLSPSVPITNGTVDLRYGLWGVIDQNNP